MGYSSALGYAESVKAGGFSLATAVTCHLSSNCFPPITRSELRNAAIVAVEQCVKGNWDAVPDRLLTGYLDEPVTARQIVEAYHLEAFVDALSEGDSE